MAAKVRELLKGCESIRTRLLGRSALTANIHAPFTTIRPENDYLRASERKGF